MADVTQILARIEDGDPDAAEQLLPLVYQELRKLASVKLASEKPGQTLQATAPVHEAYIRLIDVDSPGDWDSRGHFFAAAAEAMRRILIERARQNQGPKRGGHFTRVDLPDVELDSGQSPEDLLTLDAALKKLEQQQPRRATVVKMRFFAGLTIEQIARALGVSTTTIDNDWAYARSWLKLEMGDD